jgi:hypothetical protein
VVAERRWSCSIEVEASAEDAARLRALLPAFLRDAGYTTTSGTRTVEVAFLQATESLRSLPEQSGGRGQADGWLPQGRRGKLRGRGPDS